MKIERYKCDCCGEEYSLQIKFFPKTYVLGSYDLCQNCMKKFQDFLKGENKNEREVEWDYEKDNSIPPDNVYIGDCDGKYFGKMEIRGFHSEDRDQNKNDSVPE